MMGTPAENSFNSRSACMDHAEKRPASRDSTSSLYQNVWSNVLFFMRRTSSNCCAPLGETCRSSFSTKVTIFVHLQRAIFFCSICKQTALKMALRDTHPLQMLTMASSLLLMCSVTGLPLRDAGAHSHFVCAICQRASLWSQTLGYGHSLPKGESVTAGPGVHASFLPLP